MGGDFDTPILVKALAVILTVAALVWMGIRFADSGVSKQEVQEARSANNEGR